MTHASMPIVIAHRGASGSQPEHTVAAYREAGAAAADGWECDVQLSADAELVCIHDDDVDRTSDGTGPVGDHTLAQLRSLDWGSWKPDADHDPEVARRGPDQDADRRALVTLPELLDLVADAAARRGQGPGLCIETKHPSAHDELVEAAVLRALAEGGWWGPSATADPARPWLRIMSFSAAALERVAAAAPDLELVELVEHTAPDRLRAGRTVADAGTVGLDLQIVRADPELVDCLHAHGRRVFVWTVNEPADVVRCHDLGVAGVITDHPARTREVLRARQG